jgi:hypothetical protein
MILTVTLRVHYLAFFPHLTQRSKRDVNVATFEVHTAVLIEVQAFWDLYPILVGK